MRLSIVKTSGPFDLVGYAGLETVLCDRPALVNAESAAIQSHITLGKLKVVVAEVEGIVSDEVFGEFWAKAEGKDDVERAEMAILMAQEPEEASKKKTKAELKAEAEAEAKAKAEAEAKAKADADAGSS